MGRSKTAAGRGGGGQRLGQVGDTGDLWLEKPPPRGWRWGLPQETGLWLVADSHSNGLECGYGGHDWVQGHPCLE